MWKTKETFSNIMFIEINYLARQIHCQVNKALADACNLIVHILMNGSQIVLPIKGHSYFYFLRYLMNPHFC